MVSKTLKSKKKFFVTSWLLYSISNLKTCGVTRNPEFPQTGLDLTETGPGLGHVFKNIFGSGQVGDKDFCPVQVRVFSIAAFHISKNFGDKVELTETMHHIPKMSRYSEYRTLISML